MIETQWEAAELAGVLTTYIAGIEDTLKEPMMGAASYLSSQIDDVYDALGPIVDDAIAHADVNLPWES